MNISITAESGHVSCFKGRNFRFFRIIPEALRIIREAPKWFSEAPRSLPGAVIPTHIKDKDTNIIIKTQRNNIDTLNI